jgi:hypothetical protein
MTVTSDHPLFPPSSHLLGVERAIASSSTSTSNASPSPFPSTFTTKSTTPVTTPPRSCRRPSPLRNNSFCSDDLDRERDSNNEGTSRRGRADGQEEDGDEQDEDQDQGMMSSFCESIEENEAQESGAEHEVKAKAQAGPGSEWKSAWGLGAGSKFPLKREPSNRPKRRDSGSEVEDALELDFASPFAQAQRTGKEDVVMHHHSAGAVDPAEKPRIKSTSTVTATSGTGTPAGTAGRSYPGSVGRTINYNPSHSTLSSNSTSKSSFIRPKPSFPRSAPLRPLTLASLSHSGGSSSGPMLGAGGRYSTPHAGMMAAGSSGAGAAGKGGQGRQKVIVPKKMLRMSFDLGLTQSELAREG